MKINVSGSLSQFIKDSPIEPDEAIDIIAGLPIMKDDKIVGTVERVDPIADMWFGCMEIEDDLFVSDLCETSSMEIRRDKED